MCLNIEEQMFHHNIMNLYTYINNDYHLCLMLKVSVSDRKFEKNLPPLKLDM